MLVHEMFHAALPDLPRNALWLQEGNATWAEPVACYRRRVTWFAENMRGTPLLIMLNNEPWRLVMLLAAIPGIIPAGVVTLIIRYYLLKHH